MRGGPAMSAGLTWVVDNNQQPAVEITATETTGDPERLLPLGTMAAMAGVTQKWLRGEAESGRLPHLNADGRLLFDEATIHRLLRDRAIAASPVEGSEAPP